MRKCVLVLCALLVLSVGVPKASADSIGLNSWELSWCTTPTGSCGGPSPDWTYGLQPTSLPLAPDPFSLPATVQFTIPPPGGTGTFNVVTSFFDFDISSLTIGVNENYALQGGAGVSGQFWAYGNVNNVWADYISNLPPITLAGGPDDIAWSIDWAFNLNADQQGIVTYHFGDAPPSSGLYLQQYILSETGAPGTSLYFWSTLDIGTPGPAPVPEPGTMLLLGTGLFGLVRAARRRK